MVTLSLRAKSLSLQLRIGLRPRLVTLDKLDEIIRRCCGLVSGQDWLHSELALSVLLVVADWSQAKIGYTFCLLSAHRLPVADWSQAKIGYTRCRFMVQKDQVADWSQAKIGYTGRGDERF